jgi:hypothetical protein
MRFMDAQEALRTWRFSLPGGGLRMTEREVGGRELAIVVSKDEALVLFELLSRYSEGGLPAA